MMLFATLLSVSIMLAEPVSVDDLPPGVTWNDPVDNPEASPDSFAAVFVREPTGRGDWDYVASAWEVVLEPTPRIVPRIRFVPSGWSPTLLMDLVASGRKDLIRLQIQAPNRYRVNLYSVDYSDWTVSTVWQGEQALPVFLHGNDAYVDVARNDLSRVHQFSTDGLRVIRADNRVEKPAKTFRYIRAIPDHQDLHLVQRETGFALFDADIPAFLNLSGIPAYMDAGNTTGICVSPDRAWYATHTASDGAEQLTSYEPGDSQLVRSRVVLVERATGERTEIPISLDMAHGSGLSYLYSRPLLGFDSRGRLMVRQTVPAPAVSTDGSPAVQEFSFDPLDGARAPLPLPANPAGLVPDFYYSGPLPENVAALLDGAWHRSEEVAIAFLQTKGVQIDPRMSYKCEVDFSRDQTRFLLKSFQEGSDASFYLGDLLAGTVSKIPCPDPLVNASDMNIVILD